MELGGELEERGGWCLPGADADVLESLAEVAGADGRAGLAAGEQPWGGRVSCGGGVPAAAGQVLPGQGGEGAGSVLGAWPRRIVTWVSARRSAPDRLAGGVPRSPPWLAPGVRRHLIASADQFLACSDMIGCHGDSAVTDAVSCVVVPGGRAWLPSSCVGASHGGFRRSFMQIGLGTSDCFVSVWGWRSSFMANGGQRAGRYAPPCERAAQGADRLGLRCARDLAGAGQGGKGRTGAARPLERRAAAWRGSSPGAGAGALE
jgi:hypothetical protein